MDDLDAGIVDIRLDCPLVLMVVDITLSQLDSSKPLKILL